MKRTNSKWLLPLLLTLVTVIVCALGITAAATEESRTGRITHVNLVLDNDADLVFLADISEEAAKQKHTFMTFNDGSPVSYSGTKKVGNVTYMVYRYNNILPQDLGESVTAKLYVDSALSSISVFSVKEYCQFILNNSLSHSLKTMISDLLVYGAEAQLLTGKTENGFITDGVVGLTPSGQHDALKVVYSPETKDDLKNAPTASIIQGKLQLTNGVQLLFDVALPDDADPSEYTAVMTVNGREQVVKIAPDGYYNRAIFNGVYAYETFDLVKVAVYKGNIRVSNTMTFSLASYLEAMNKSEKYAAITDAYYNYAYSSHVYSGTHSVSMPGEVISNNAGNALLDDYGTMVYNCSVCGKLIDNLEITNLRTFDDAHTNGSLENKDNSGNTRFTVENTEEILENGSSNKYLSIIRNTDNTGDGNLNYYIKFGHTMMAQAGEGSKYVDSKSQFINDKFTLSFDVKAPEGGISESAIYLQNHNTSGSGRFAQILTIESDGSLTNDTAKIASAGTVKSDSWTNITVTIDFYTVDETTMICYEYYVNNELVSTVAIPNPLLNDKFTQVYMVVPTANLSDGQGIFFDNFIFAQGCVHSFTESTADHVKKTNNANLRELIDKVHNDFDELQFSYVVRWDGSSERTYTEYQGLRTMDTDLYEPLEKPRNFNHPRLFFNSSDIPRIVESLEKEENANAKSVLTSYVTSNVDGILPSTDTITPKAFEHTNYSTSILRVIEAKAFYYAIYKDDTTGEHDDALLRGYEAIYAMKNYLLTFDVQWKMSDQCRYYGEVMYYSALVYDWCYDLLTEDDKIQFRLGVQNLCCDGTSNAPWLGETHEGRKLEGGFPALAVEHQTALTGHGAEAQVLRDYFSFAIAIFDEDPTWYDYVGGMIYQNYVDARDYFYTSGFYPDGSAGYNCYRFLCDLYNAWLFRGMGVEIPYNDEDMATVVHGLMAMEICDLFQFATADGSGTSWAGQYRIGDTIGDCALISSYLFQDDAAFSIAKRLCDYRYQGSFYTHQLGTSVTNYIILTSIGLTGETPWNSEIDNIEYHGGFQQQIIARNGRDEDSTVVLLQGPQHYPGGHTHQSAGSFQIWYKGMLSRDDGLYDAYGSDHHFYYHMSATAHNTLLVYNPSVAGSTFGPNQTTAYYNGGQKYELSLPTTYPSWIANEKYSYGEVIGMDYDSEENPSYVYFANDITKAYDDITVDYVERSFMTLYTEDEETPMIMFIFDNITSDNPNFQKTFLLQCAEEPLVEGNKVTVDNGEGKMVLTSLLGADSIKAYGRTSVNGAVQPGMTEDDPNYGSERFYLSGAGTNLLPGGAGSIGDSNSDLNIVWGHVEVQPNKGNATNHLMNVIYVSDSGTTVSATPTLIESGYITGASFKNYTSVFVNDPMHSSDAHSFTTEGDGTMTYYVGGLNEGTWKVSVNGVDIGEFSAHADAENPDKTGKIITFEAEAGTVELTPGDDIRPANTGLIYYNLNGGKLPEGTPPYYEFGKVTSLPIPTKTDSRFLGWFTEKECINQIKEIPADSTSVYKLYAKWFSPIIYADYSDGKGVGDYPLHNATEAGSGALFKIVNDNKDRYMLWTTTGSGSLITQDGRYSIYADESLEVSFSLTLGKNGNDPLIPVSIYLRDTKTNLLLGKTGNAYLNIFKTDGSGNAYLGTSIKFDQIPGSGLKTLRFVLDFGKGEIRAYDENANCIKKVTMGEAGIPLPAVYSSYEDYFRNLDGSGNSLFTMKGNGAGALRVGQISVWPGDVSGSCSNFGPNSSTHSWNEGVVIKAPSAEDCTPGTMQFTCTECNLTKEVPLTSENPHASMAYKYENDKLSYECQTCHFSYAISTGFVLDGSSYNGIIGSNNAKDYTTNEGTHQPVINTDLAYELINKTGNKADLELWVPTMDSDMYGFSSANNAAGFLSLKLNAAMDEGLALHLVDTSTNSTRWSSEWCMKEAFLTLSAPKSVDGVTTVDVLGLDGILIKTVETDSKGYTGWIDVKIYIELDPEEDTVTLSYYADGQYVDSATRELTTAANAFNSICISGTTATRGSGLVLDDIYFGFTANGKWELVGE